MTAELVERLRASFAHPEQWVLRSDGETYARAQALLREHVVRLLDEALVGAEARGLLVKGEALARTVYPQAWMRVMSDIDLIVLPADVARVVRGLEDAGFTRDPLPAHRAHSLAMFNEIPLSLPVGEGAFTLELHTTLDKLVARPIDFAEVMARASTVHRSLLLPTAEDQLLLVVLHAAASDFDHAPGWLDMHLLLGAPLDTAALIARTHQWQLRTALFVAMCALRAAGSDRVPDELIEACRPTGARRRLLRRCFDLHRFPMHRAGRRLGARWVARQLPLRDDTTRWLAGCGRYGLMRLLDRATP